MNDNFRIDVSSLADEANDLANQIEEHHEEQFRRDHFQNITIPVIALFVAVAGIIVSVVLQLLI